MYLEEKKSRFRWFEPRVAYRRPRDLPVPRLGGHDELIGEEGGELVDLIGRHLPRVGSEGWGRDWGEGEGGGKVKVGGRGRGRAWGPGSRQGVGTGVDNEGTKGEDKGESKR